LNSTLKMEGDVSEKPASGLSYYQVLTGLPPPPMKPKQQEKKVEQERQNPSDDLPPSGFTPRNIQRNRNTLPKARQKMGPPAEEVYTSDNMSRTVSGENVNSQTYYYRGRGRGNYPNTRGSPKSYRGNSRDSSYSHSNTLPRSRGGGSRGRGQYDSYGSLPRRGGRQGDVSYQANYDNRGRGRGRGNYQGRTGSQGQLNTQDQITRAPSQRRIDSMQRKRKMNIDKTKSFHEHEIPRASSLPRNPVKRSLPDLMTNTFSSSNSIWSPDGKCPSFADILKRGSEEALEQTEQPVTMMNTNESTTFEEEVLPGRDYQVTRNRENIVTSSDIYTSTSFAIPEGFGSVPCLNQEMKNEQVNTLDIQRQEETNSLHMVQSSTIISNNSLSLFSNNDDIAINEAAVLEPSISQTVQIEKTESEKLIIECTQESSNENFTDEVSFNEKVDKPNSDDNISISSQKTSRFGAIKSYANILSGGLKKVGSVFGLKNKDNQATKKEKSTSDIKQDAPNLSKDYKENIEPMPATLIQSSKEPDTEKPDIPGLLFKTDLERRPSRKKKRSRPSSTFEIECKPEMIDANDSEENTASDLSKSNNQQMTFEISKQKKSVEVQEGFEEIQLTENERNNSMTKLIKPCMKSN